MTSPPLAAPPPDSGEPSLLAPPQSVRSFLSKTLAIVAMDLRKLRRDPTELLTRAIQPALWLLVFGQVFTLHRAIPTGELPYQDFMAPGILAQSVLFIAIFYGISVIWERDLGIVHKLLVTPTPERHWFSARDCRPGAGHSRRRSSFIFLAWTVRRKNRMDSASAVAGVLIAVVLGARLVFHIFAHHRLSGEDAGTIHGHRPGLDHADVLREQRDLPFAMMPSWLRAVAWVQSAHLRGGRIRALMLVDGVSEFGLAVDFLVLIGTTGVLTLIGRMVIPSPRPVGWVVERRRRIPTLRSRIRPKRKCS